MDKINRFLVAAIGCLLTQAALAQATTTQWPTGIGFPNVARTEGELIGGPFATADGRTAILAWHNGILFSMPESPSSNAGSNLQSRMFSLMNPADPRIIINAPANAQGSLGTTTQPVNAHGYLHVGQHMQSGASGPFLVLGTDFQAPAPWSFRAQAGVPGVARLAAGIPVIGVRGVLQLPWFISQTYWSYNPLGGNTSLYTNGPPGAPGSTLQSTWDHLGLTGVIGHPFLLGNLLIYASDQSRTGVATYDISDPTQPLLLDVLTQGGPGGYWPELWGNDGELYLVFPYNNNGNGMRVVDITDPANMRFIADVPLARPSGSNGPHYAQFQDEFAFIGDHKIDMRTRQSVRQFNTVANSVDMSQFALPLGNLLITGGIGSPGQGIAIFAHQAAPDTRPPNVAFHIPRAAQTGYPRGAPISLLIHETLDTLSIVNGDTFMLRRMLGPASFGPPLAGGWTFSFNDVFTFQPTQALQADATYEVRVAGIRDAAGNAMLPYVFTFSTGVASGGNRPPLISSFSATPYPAAPAQTVDFLASASDPDGDPLEYRFDFGDGSVRTPWSGVTNATRSYASAGHYRASVQVRDPAGVIATRTRVVTVLTALPTARPSTSATIICDAPARRVWTVNSDTDTISVLNADSLLKLAEYPSCDNPRALARAPGGAIWVACQNDDRIRIHSEVNGSVLATIETGYGSGPTGIALSPDGTQAYVALGQRGELRRYNVANRQQTGALALGPTARGVAVSADGARVLVTRFISPLHHGEVWDVNAATLQLTRVLNIPKFGDEENRDLTASGRGVANYLAGVTLSPRSGRAFVPATKPNSERGLLIHASQDLDQDNTVRNLLVELDPAAATPAARFRRGIDLDNSDSASAVAFSPLGDYVLVTEQGMNSLLVLDALALDASSGLGAMVTRLVTGAAPHGVCTDSMSGRTFVHNFMGRSVTALETANLFSEGALQAAASEIQMVAAETLSPAVLLGKRIFYHAADPRMSAEGYLSCATCHVDGADDGRTWDFSGRGEGLRNTHSLLGRGGSAHGNVHWSANFDEIQDFENDIRSFFGGTGFMSNADFTATSNPLGPVKAGRSADLDALADYVNSLGNASILRSPFRAADGGFTAAAIQGEQIFAREGCAACHLPPQYTSATNTTVVLHNVGTLRASSGTRIGGALSGIDTPTLRGVWASAPYLHDGSAITLSEVFTQSGGITLAAENASLSGGASLINSFVELNNDDSVRGRAFVRLVADANRLTFNAVDGGSGGLGAIELRYSNSRSGAQTQPLNVRVNGVALPLVNLPPSNNDPSFRATNWSQFRLENVMLNPGLSNGIEFSTPNFFTSIDEIVIANANQLALTQPHRRLAALPVGERDAVLAFLRQLDGSNTPGGTDVLFVNGFEN